MSTDLRAASLANHSRTVRRDPDSTAAPVAFVSSWRAQAVLALLTVACLLPFSGKAFHIDDPIFIWSAQQILHHPLDCYGFNATWWARETPMWQIQQNPPLAAYYMALVGSIAGWSERALHLGFLLPAVIVVLATYRLGLRLTQRPFLAAIATLVAPGFLVSATGLMCDVSMVALWMLAVLFWIEGLEQGSRPLYLSISALLIAACALTKYFGMALVPLLFAYSWWRQRSLRSWIGYLFIPVIALAGYEFYTRQLYGYGLISLAAGRPSTSGSGLRKMTVVHSNYLHGGGQTLRGRVLAGLMFAGGCALPALTFAPVLWRRRHLLWGTLTAAALALAFWQRWINTGSVYSNEEWLHSRLGLISLQMFFLAAGGISLVALALADFWKKRDAASLLVGLWVFGTMFFAVIVNWDVNARTMLPMIPAVAILIARRIDEGEPAFHRWRWIGLAAPVIVAAGVSLWVAAGDAALANTAREAANLFHERSRGESSTVWFEGRWGFEYYMQQFGARAVEPEAEQCKFGDLVVIPKYNTSQFKFPLASTPAETVDFDVHTWVTPMNPDAGAGFYFSGWGPLPFVFGPVPAQRYLMARVLHNP